MASVFAAVQDSGKNTASHLRTQLLTEAMERAVQAGPHEATASVIDNESIVASLRRCRNACLASALGVAALAALIALVILVTLRPPFVLRFEYDAHRPWKGTMRISGVAIVVSVLIVVLMVSGGPLVLSAVAR